MFAFDKDTQERIFSTAEARVQGKKLEGIEEYIGEIMDMHPEFDELWPRGEVALIAQPVQGQVVNPFVHLVLHGIVGHQLRVENPLFVAETYNRLKDQGMEPHDILHALMSVYGDLHFRGVRQGGQFDLLDYESHLEQMWLEDAPDGEGEL